MDDRGRMGPGFVSLIPRGFFQNNRLREPPEILHCLRFLRANHDPVYARRLTPMRAIFGPDSALATRVVLSRTTRKVTTLI